MATNNRYFVAYNPTGYCGRILRHLPALVTVYEPSKAALGLVPESKRTVKSEDRTWDETHPPKLSDLCLLVIVANFEKRTIFDELPCWEKNHLLEILPTNLPLPLVTTHIQDEIYWERMVKDRWKDEANYCQDYGSSWKRMYLEKHVQEAVEAMTPEGFDFDYIEDLTNITKRYVKNLNLRELQIMQPLVRSEEENEFAVLPEPCDHIDLCPTLIRLENLTELHVQFGLRNVGAEYKSSWFQFSEADCSNLGSGVSLAEKLRLLRVHSCNLNDKRLIALLSSMNGNKSLEEINFSNCLIGDDGATGIAKFMKDRPTLKRINLCNNRIRENGVHALAFMLTQSHSSPVEYLNLKFNVFGDAGFKYLASALVRDRTHLKVLNVSCCGLEETSGILLGETLVRNSMLTEVEVCNNHLGERAGRALEKALRENKTIQFLDLRMTEIKDQDFEAINLALHFNRIRALRGESGVEIEYKLLEKRKEELRKKQEAEELMAEEMLMNEEAAKQGNKESQDS